MRRSTVARYYWSRYRIPSQMPKFDGPAPVAAPQNMNSTKTNEFIDPIDDKFPVSIRGNLVRPDVPEDQYVDSWYVCTSMTHHLGDFRPWSASAPANAYRFRPYNEFDSKGRDYVEQLRKFSRYAPQSSRGKGAKGFPFREAFLTKMNTAETAVVNPTRETIMTRAVAERLHHAKVLSPLEVQRDVGRLEEPLPCAGKIPAERSTFPFRWNTEDWYEYEVAKARNKRFVFENTNDTGISASEVTYRIVLEGFWDHHVMKLADDVVMFLKDVGRQVVEEKLKSVRASLESLSTGGAVDPELVAAFNASLKGPFGGPDRYDAEEVAHFLRTELVRLEEQCVSLINRANVPIPGTSNIYDANVSWPHVEKMEPWTRMAEFWTSSSDTSFTELEMSTAHYEFRKYFRVVVVKMPFQSTELEQRIYGIRHWLHRQTSCEFHTTYKRNVVHDSAVFPTEHDPETKPSHEHHRLFSFALDWQSAPVDYLSVELAREGDSWASLAKRLGCSESELRAANDTMEEVAAGVAVSVPGSATRRLTSFSTTPSVLPLQQGDGKPAITSWRRAAEVLGCSVEELQQANGAAALTYISAAESGDGAFDPAVKELVVPHTATAALTESSFAAFEPTFDGDTWTSIADRLGCSEGDLRACNSVDGSVADVSSLAAVSVPASATRPRRIIHPQLRPQAATDALLARTLGEQAVSAIGDIPSLPANAHKFPHEYYTPTSRFPATPQQSPASDNWIAYTAKYLDKQLALQDEPAPVYNVNKLWPMQQVPGKVDQTPFEEDQTWLMHPIPVQQMQQHHPEKDLQDLPFVNHEQFPRSLEWTAP
ncbi:LysM domain containing protein [Leishmania donovani]|uniref:LysM domain family protein n=1 Tax=Leishmania donovani TaxID=5661 RepID=A0A504YA20_LEIDO|nr:LysM domain family protein [Leishmania donovani]CAJ1991958.1 LysM domain containing protein [Leishmania donovani]VDZ47795.1 LysM_domain_containing_protein_putative/Pfam:PF01476 [Leishmania donovani]